MHKTAVLNVVGLTPSLIGDATPALSAWTRDASLARIKSAFPAVTCSAQSDYLTGTYPEQHGIVGNGWYAREDAEVRFWKQANRLMHGKKIWETARSADPSFTCANLFWWFNMYSTVDYSVTPRPMYPADGRKIPDVYTAPGSLRDELQSKLGTFPLFEFWGPRAGIRSTRWIADAAMLIDRRFNPTLTLIYLPHLDYNLQRLGPGPAATKDLHEIDGVCGDLIKHYESTGARVIVLSEYGIRDVTRPIHLNRVLRQHGWIAVRDELVTLLLAAIGLGSAAGCMRPPPEPPGLGEQPVWHYERNPATMPTAGQPRTGVGPAESTDDPDSPGTVRTPPAAQEDPMDSP